VNPRFFSKLAVLATLTIATPCEAVDWSAQASLGVDNWFAPEAGGHGFAIFDLRGRHALGRSDFHFYYNTETVQLSVENVPLGSDSLQLSAGIRGELGYAGILRDYFVDARKDITRGFFASYVYVFTSVKWLPGGPHSLEAVLGGRQWIFARDPNATSSTLALPVDPTVFEPRIRYTFWNINAPSDEWQAQVLFPRIRGVTAGIELGADIRSNTTPWATIHNTNNHRNAPKTVILMARQWLRLGTQISPRWRFQFDENASWGIGEDDLTRVRAGGMNPYSVTIPGLPWPALLCERLLAGNASVHLRPSLYYRHEFGVAFAGGFFNDIHRDGSLDTFGFASGASAFADLRFWRMQVYARVGAALPVGAIPDRLHLSAMIAVGLSVF
jgi:hypothetical protein